MSGPTWEWDADTYDRVADPHVRWGTAVLDRLRLTGAETVLDCGCGSGRVTELLLNRLPQGRVAALDVSRAMLDVARRRLAWAGERVAYFEVDLLDVKPRLLGPLAPVDAILSTATFHWVTDHERLFSNLVSTPARGSAGRSMRWCRQCRGPAGGRPLAGR